MKLPSPLSAAQRKALDAALTPLDKLLRYHAAVLKTLRSFRDTETKVLAKIASLETALGDGTDEKALKVTTELAERRQQIVLLRASIAHSESQIGHWYLVDLRQALLVAHATLQAVLKVVPDRHRAEIAALLLPFCESKAGAMQLASQTPSLAYVAGKCGETFRGSTADVPGALAASEELKATISRVLAGEDVFPDYQEARAASVAATLASNKARAEAIARREAQAPQSLV